MLDSEPLSEDEINARTSEMVLTSVVASASAMAWFEWLINLPDELEVIWRRRRSIATWIYACARYSSMAAVIPLFISFASHNRYEECFCEDAHCLV
ncbi:hypothetical protein BC629DRAFT_790597 [Irpex lacteus]|nr:hypothetical protein BC629DRAFT_790597 [Irpex lacteus]